MPTASVHYRHNMIKLGKEEYMNDFADDVRIGLSSDPKTISPKYFYDDEGSFLFEQICELPEYYLTRAEAEILDQNAADICKFLPSPTDLVELGSGSAIKTRFLIEGMLEKYDKLTYHPIDISPTMLEQSSIDLLQRYENLNIISVAAEYQKGLTELNMNNNSSKLVIWLGSSIGNFERSQAVGFLKNIANASKPNDYILVGFDLRKDPAILEAAYNDTRGITSAFNLNLLKRINRELGGNFIIDDFEHKAFFNDPDGRIEMHLISLKEQCVSISGIGSDFEFGINETIHTENSYKYSFEDIEVLARQAGIELVKSWLDSKKYFSLNLFKQKKY